MSNVLEQLSFENTENYQRYLERMTKSIVHSSKGYIPMFTDGCIRILDVGCGSGILMKVLHERNPEAELYGIDLNSQVIEICEEKYPEFEFNACSLSDLVELVSKGIVRPFDCVVFSSVLHEFSSYDTDFPFSSYPIQVALEQANKCLVSGGKLIIRDGIRSDNGEIVRFRVKRKEDCEFVKRFVKEYKGIENIYCDFALEDTFAMHWKDLKEFFFKFTWGAASWNREINEKFGILSVEEWKDIVCNTGFSIQNYMVNAERYLKHILEKVEFIDYIPREFFSEMTIVICARKVEE